MSDDPEATLAYGIYLGATEGGYRVGPAGEYGGLSEEFENAHRPEYVDDPEDDGQFHLQEYLEAKILEAAGVSDPEPEMWLRRPARGDWSDKGETSPAWEEWRSRKKAALAELDVEVDRSGSWEFPGYVLLIGSTKLTVEWSNCIQLDLATRRAWTIDPDHPDDSREVHLERGSEGWDHKLARVLDLAELPPHEGVRPGWLIYPFYG